MEQQEVLEKFGRRLREARKARNISQLDLGLECGLSQTYLSEVESGKRNISLANIYKLAVALNVPVAELVADID